jgi:hypothetical protein
MTSCLVVWIIFYGYIFQQADNYGVHDRKQYYRILIYLVLAGFIYIYSLLLV